MLRLLVSCLTPYGDSSTVKVTRLLSSVVEPPSLDMKSSIPRVDILGGESVCVQVNGPAPVSWVHVLLANGVVAGLVCDP